MRERDEHEHDEAWTSEIIHSPCAVKIKGADCLYIDNGFVVHEQFSQARVILSIVKRSTCALPFKERDKGTKLHQITQ